jgi:hypothetical protein
MVYAFMVKKYPGYFMPLRHSRFDELIGTVPGWNTNLGLYSRYVIKIRGMKNY